MNALCALSMYVSIRRALPESSAVLHGYDFAAAFVVVVAVAVVDVALADDACIRFSIAARRAALFSASVGCCDG